MTGHKEGLRAKAAMGVAALTLFFAQIACGGAPKIDPCDEAFQALTTAFSGTRPGVVGDDAINVWPADPSGRATHPRIPNWQGRENVSWREVASYMRSNCDGQYEVRSLATDQDERFYDDGVIVKKRSQQNFTLPEQSLNWVNGMLVATVAVLGISALLGTKKLIAA